MSGLTFKDLVLDVTDDDELVPTMVTFWSKLTGLPLNDHGDGDWNLVPPTDQPTKLMWIDRVPERAVDPSRVHLAVVGGPTSNWFLTTAGAELLGNDQGDQLYRAPDGLIVRVLNESSTLGPITSLIGSSSSEPATSSQDYDLDDTERPSICALVVESTSPAQIAEWWRKLLGGNITVVDGGAVLLTEAAGFPYRAIAFVPNAGRKLVKNRMHWDVVLPSADISPLISTGATLLREPTETCSWWVLQDPDGNEFCAFRPKPSAES